MKGIVLPGVQVQGFIQSLKPFKTVATLYMINQ